MVEGNVIYVMVMRDLIKFFRERSRLISTFMRPLIWLFFIGMGMSRLVHPEVIGVDYIKFIFPGIIGMTILFSAMFSSISIIWDKEFGFMKEILVAPVKRISIVTGKAISGTILSTIQTCVILILAPFLGIELSLSSVILTIIFSLILSFVISSLGIVIASFYESLESFSVIMNFIVMPMFFLSGAMYPVSGLPLILKYLSFINPLTYGIDALKHALLPGGTLFDFRLYTDLTVLILCGIIFLYISSYVFERRV